MSFDEIEATGKRLLEQFPVVKHAIKRVYQGVSVAISRNKVRAEGNIYCVSPNDGFEYFYGYYDKSPWDATDRYMICLRVQQAYKSVAPKEPGTVCLIDSGDGNKLIEIATTHSWNVQQGCMAQWMGPDYKSRIIYNDFRSGKYYSVIYNVINRKEEKVLPLPVYDVSRDGSFALSLDFSRLHRMRPGYGYSNLPDRTKGILCPDECCIWKMDIPSGKVTELFKYTDFAAFEPDSTMASAEHKVNHLMINPNGKRFMVLHRWFQKGRKHTRLVTVNIDGTEMYNLSDDVFVSHCFWKNDSEILSFLRKKDTGEHYYLMQDKTRQYSLLWPRLRTDGHCSYSPNGRVVITDTYPNRQRKAFLYTCIEEQKQPVRIAKLYSPFKYDNDCRCDLHPRWNRAGNEVCIDSVHEGKRGLYVISLEKKDIPPVPGKKPELREGKYKIVYLITQCKNSGPMNQTLNMIKYLDREMFQPIIITLFQEDLGNSIIQRFLDVVPEFYCLNMSKLQSLIIGRKNLADLLETIKPDMIHGLGMPPYTMSLEYRDTIHLVTLRNYCYQDYPDKYGRWIGLILACKDMALIKKQIKFGETIVTCSASLSHIYEEKQGIKLEFIRNGVDIDKYEYANGEKRKIMKRQLGLPLDKYIILYSGQFIDRKNQKFAIEGVLKSCHFSEVYMVLMGDGPNLDNLRKLYADDKRVLFTGSVTNVDEYLQAGDLYVSASKSEGLPNGVLEAMSSGLPVLLSDIPQHLEILGIQDGFGLSYRQGDYDDFTDKFDALLKMDLNKLGHLASDIVRNDLSAREMSLKYQNLYRKLIEKRGSL